MGRIGVHHPREIVRVERDYTGGEIVQFSSAYPLELEGRVSIPFFFRAVFAMSRGVLIFLYSCRSRPGSLWKVSTPSTRSSYQHTAYGIR